LETRDVVERSGGALEGRSDLKGDLSDKWAIRSLHFETSLGLSQTEVRIDSSQGVFDHQTLCFAVHRAFRTILEAHSTLIELEKGVAVLGGGGGALPMGLRAEPIAAQTSESKAVGSKAEALASLGPISVVEYDHRIAAAASDFFGFPADAKDKSGSSQYDMKLFVMDAIEFIERRPVGATDSFSAIFVDVASPDSGDAARSGLHAPPLEFLSESFVRNAAVAVQQACGFVAWNVIVGAADEAAGLRVAVAALERGVPSGFSVFALGPMQQQSSTSTPASGITQWLVVATAVEAEALHAVRSASGTCRGTAPSGMGDAGLRWVHASEL